MQELEKRMEEREKEIRVKNEVEKQNQARLKNQLTFYLRLSLVGLEIEA